MKQHLLDFSKAFSFFRENLLQVNELSNEILETLQEKPGTFHAFLPETMSFEEIHSFSEGGKTSSLRKEISVELTKIINSNNLLSCIFDDFNSDVDDIGGNDLYQSHGIHYKKEVYYQIHSGASQETILKCLSYSSTIWHSLVVVFRNNSELQKEKKEIDKDFIKIICRNAIFVMVEAYDSESYIYWCDSDGSQILKNMHAETN